MFCMSSDTVENHQWSPHYCEEVGVTLTVLSPPPPLLISHSHSKATITVLKGCQTQVTHKMQFLLISTMLLLACWKRKFPHGYRVPIQKFERLTTKMWRWSQTINATGHTAILHFSKNQTPQGNHRKWQHQPENINWSDIKAFDFIHSAASNLKVSIRSMFFLLAVYGCIQFSSCFREHLSVRVATLSLCVKITAQRQEVHREVPFDQKRQKLSTADAL